MSEQLAGARAPIVLSVRHAKDELRKISVKDDLGQYELYRISPTAANWPAEDVWDEVNPRSHDENCLRGKVAADIEKTLRNEPNEFWLANRGGFLLADRVRFDPDRSLLQIHLSDQDIHGLADGATSNAVIAKLQAEQRDDDDDDLAAALKVAKFNLDVVVGLTDHDRIAKLVQGRNRSVQVKEWSLNDFRGGFDWLKEVVDKEGGPFEGRVGWEENSTAPTSVLDLISLLTLFHRSYDGDGGRRRGAPTVAFSSKGTADKRLLDPKMAKGYEALTPVLEEVIRLHDHVAANFQKTYEVYNRQVLGKGAKLGKRRGVERREVTLPLTGAKADYRVDKGLLYPLLAAHRCLLSYRGGTVGWRIHPRQFFDEYGPDLVGRLFDEYDKLGKNPASVGKNRSVYETLIEKAENFLLNRNSLAAE